MNWDVLGAIGQFIEAIVVLVSAPLIFWQLRQLRTEQTHSRWVALQWAISVVRTEDIDLLLDMASDGIPYNPSRFSEAASRLLSGLYLVYQAWEDGYLDLDLYLVAQADELAGLHPDNLERLPTGRSKVIRQINKCINQTDSKPARMIDMAAKHSLESTIN